MDSLGPSRCTEVRPSLLPGLEEALLSLRDVGDLSKVVGFGVTVSFF